MGDLERAYRTCQQITRREAKNFYYAFITLPRRKRCAIHVVYAFCRLCDDATDEPIALEVKLTRLQEMRGRLNQALDGNPDGPVFTALADVAKVFNIPQRYFEGVISGVEMDLTKNRFETFEELKEYCFGVAGVVGLMCVEVFGYRDTKAREYAIDLGLAMQLTNIIRDVKEDLGSDRIYIPRQDMARFGYTEQQFKQGVMNNAFRALMSFEAQRAHEHFSRGFQLLPLLSLRARACPAILGAIYSRLLDRIEANNFNVFNGKMRLSGREKLYLATKTWLKSMLPFPRLSPV